MGTGLSYPLEVKTKEIEMKLAGVPVKKVLEYDSEESRLQEEVVGQVFVKLVEELKEMMPVQTIYEYLGVARSTY